MNEFEKGFVAYATEGGLPENQAVHLWKRAMDYPGTQEMFKQLTASLAPTEKNLSNEELQALSSLMEQQKAHSEMMNLKNQLGI